MRWWNHHVFGYKMKQKQKTWVTLETLQFQFWLEGSGIFFWMLHSRKVPILHSMIVDVIVWDNYHVYRRNWLNHHGLALSEFLQANPSALWIRTELWPFVVRNTCAFIRKSGFHIKEKIIKTHTWSQMIFMMELKRDQICLQNYFVFFP